MIMVQMGIRLRECSAFTFGEFSGSLIVRTGKKAKFVPLNSTAREAIAVLVVPRLDAATTKAKAVAALWPRPGTSEARKPLFVSQKGQEEPLSSSGMGQVIAEIVKAAGDRVPEETTAHTLRHTFAHTYLEQYPGDTVGLATPLGHSSLDTTRRYSQPTTIQLSMRVERLKINAYGQK